MSPTNGGDLLVALLRQAEVDVVFGIVSVHNLPLVEAVARDLRFVPVRHEAAAVNAADGYARVSGRLGVALTSTGTGAGNAAGSLVEAHTASSRVLHVTGQIESCYLGLGRGVIHETADQLGMLRSVSRFAATIGSTGESASTLVRAIAAARTAPYGPASVEWPIDLQFAEHDVDVVLESSGVAAPAPTTAELAQAAALVSQSSRPVIWAGGGAREAREPLRLLAERLAAPVLTSNSGRGSIAEDHPLVVGNFAATPAGADLLSAADLLISVGTHFRSNETRDYALRMPTNHLQIDADSAAIGRVYPAAVGIVADAAQTLAGLLTALPATAGAEPSWTARGGQVRHSVRATLTEDIAGYAGICQTLRAQLPLSTPIARDVTIPSSQWGNRLLDIHHPSTNVFPVGGGIGQGLAMGIGAALGRPEVPTVVMVGDGGLAVHLGELATLAQEQPRLIVLLFNDRGYGVLRNMQDKYRPRRAGVDLTTPDFALLCAAFALPYAHVDNPEHFDTALREAIGRSGPSVIELDADKLSAGAPMFVPPVSVH